MSASSGERTLRRCTAPALHRDSTFGGLLKNHHYLTVTELVVSLKNHHVIHCDGVGGLLKNHRACRDCWSAPDNLGKLFLRTCMLTLCGNTRNACSVTREIRGRVRCEVHLPET